MYYTESENALHLCIRYTLPSSTTAHVCALGLFPYTALPSVASPPASVALLQKQTMNLFKTTVFTMLLLERYCYIHTVHLYAVIASQL